MFNVGHLLHIRALVILGWLKILPSFIAWCCSHEFAGLGEVTKILELALQLVSCCWCHLVVKTMKHMVVIEFALRSFQQVVLIYSCIFDEECWRSFLLKHRKVFLGRLPMCSDDAAHRFRVVVSDEFIVVIL